MAHLELTQDNIPTTGKNLRGQERRVFTLPASQRAFGPRLSQVGKQGDLRLDPPPWGGGRKARLRFTCGFTWGPTTASRKGGAANPFPILQAHGSLLCPSRAHHDIYLSRYGGRPSSSSAVCGVFSAKQRPTRLGKKSSKQAASDVDSMRVF